MIVTRHRSHRSRSSSPAAARPGLSSARPGPVGPSAAPQAAARTSDLLAACLDVALTASDRAARAAADRPELLRRVEQARRELLAARELLGVERGKAA